MTDSIITTSILNIYQRKTDTQLEFKISYSLKYPFDVLKIIDNLL
jgi:hypothetical protein